MAFSLASFNGMPNSPAKPLKVGPFVVNRPPPLRSPNHLRVLDRRIHAEQPAAAFTSQLPSLVREHEQATEVGERPRRVGQRARHRRTSARLRRTAGLLREQEPEGPRLLNPKTAAWSLGVRRGRARPDLRERPARALPRAEARPPERGSLGVSRLDGKEDEIRFMSTRGLPKKLSSKQEWVGWALDRWAQRGVTVG